MNAPERQAQLKEWLASRPKCVQKLAAEFPVFSAYLIDGERHRIIGYTEGDDLILWPETEDGKAAPTGAKRYAHAHCLRKQTPLRIGEPTHTGGSNE